MKYKIYTIDPNTKDDHLSIHLAATSATKAAEMVKELEDFLAKAHPEKECLRESCPNCKDPDPDIKPCEDGSCGVCGGKGYITWKEIGKIVPTPKPEKEEKVEVRMGNTHICFGKIKSDIGNTLVIDTEEFSTPKPELKEIEKIGYLSKDSTTKEIVKWTKKVTEAVNTLLRERK